MKRFYVTYGNGYRQRHCYSVVEAPDYETARAVVEGVCGNNFAFCYTEKEFEGQVERFGLTRIVLQPQTKEDENDSALPSW